MNGAVHFCLAALARGASMSCASDVSTLKGAFAGDFRMGASLGSVALDKEDYQYPVREDADELAVLAREFNSVTAENSLKWLSLQPREGFLDALTDAQREKTVFPVDNSEWRKWDNRHRSPRQGASFEEMTEPWGWQLDGHPYRI